MKWKFFHLIVNGDQQDATILVYLFIPNQLYMFRATSSPIIRSTWLYLQLLILSTGIAGVMDEMERSSISSMTPAIPVDNTRRCKYNQVLLMMGEDISRNM